MQDCCFSFKKKKLLSMQVLKKKKKMKNEKIKIKRFRIDKNQITILQNSHTKRKIKQL